MGLVAAMVAGSVLAADAALDSRGWTPGVVAAGTGVVLTPAEPAALAVPPWLVPHVTGRTFVFYYSPTCGHCQQSIGEVVELAERLRGRVAFLGVSTTGAAQPDIEAFRSAYGVTFPLLQDDADRSFARAVMARSTPTVVVLDVVDGAVSVVDRYKPWMRGYGGLFLVRNDPASPFAHFASDDGDRVQGARTCSACHVQEAASLELTHHQVAYRTLYLRDRAEDVSCVGCHVTGMTPGGVTMGNGFRLGDHSSPLAGVTCESCHSPGGPHDGHPVDARASCVTCHDAKHSIAFSLEKGLPHIDHFLVNRLSSEELGHRYDLLLSGEAPRPLLAFPEGVHQGAEACRACHAEEYKTWRKSPHPSAFRFLQGEDAAKLECATCHATPKAGVTSASGVDQLETAGGVGCESCHGPGEAHVANPRVDNIVGLGESCPECVIEEVCTSCHTPRWDPTWDLKSHLQRVRESH